MLLLIKFSPPAKRNNLKKISFNFNNNLTSLHSKSLKIKIKINTFHKKNY